jgi:hypothetical protein
MLPPACASATIPSASEERENIHPLLVPALHQKSGTQSLGSILNGMQPSVSLITIDEECKDPTAMPSRMISQMEAIPESWTTGKPPVTISVKLERTQEIKDKDMMEDGSKSTSLRRPETETLTEEQKILELTRRQMMQGRKPSE